KASGVKWAVFTANQALRNAFARLCMELIPVCIADRAKLPSECQAGWGSYYCKRPYVMAGNVAESCPELIERLLG
ncbi:MAG TPA: thermostable hemolysin, partial [Burkholderiales bacterium]|nr:thermostable hemolysin [Burkholderiales bacterium]